ncbi:sugar phosphate isomerase/epimerase family protein [Brachybacterium saurashtrense]|uniref:Sugar phosphate isomerase/epimerase n=1 Tax=Brachybacterium saurashtrense TaxID=556288 RepID=A0A345YQY1_9MICO|nr:sugar phosphate isomerase/epimerase [Brachybacterium saurashtrense]AXK46333.1 sugar phosphate isomerase/epimerase [Brachybacterium saurashtrense]RRR24073.1 sugar phosphate isomerase/epimerase [Brachybacterium saurashtrense]
MPEHGILTDRAHTAAAYAAGADYVEPTVLRNLLVQDEHGTWQEAPHTDAWQPAPSFAVIAPADLGLADPAADQDRLARHLRLVMTAAARRARPGARIVLGSGAARRTPDGVEPAAARAQLARSVRLARDLAAEQGLEAILEPLHRGETDQITTLAGAIAFLDEHDLGDMRVVADLFHLMREHEDLEVVRRHAGRIAHAHLADTDRRPPGQGDWPLAAFLTALREGGYQGAVSIECEWQDLAAEAADALAAVRAADPSAAPASAPTAPSAALPAGSSADGPREAAVTANGGWCWFQDERALVDAATGTLLLGAVASVGGADGERRGGDVDLHVVDLDRLGEEGAASTLTLHPGLESDDHDNPALWRRTDGRWLAVYSRHKSDDLTRWRLSDSADPAGSWGPERSFDWTALFGSAEEAERLGGRRGVTYQNLHALDGVLHCFVRAINDDPCYLVSHDDGETWEFGGRLLTREKVGYVNGYARYASGTRFGTEDRIDLIITEHHPRDYGTSIWHGYLAGDRLHRADGTAVGALGRGLTDPTPRAEDLTCVLENGSTRDGAVLTHAWTTDLRRFPDGTLVALMTARADDTLGTATSRHETDPIDHRFLRGVLRPGESAWQVRELAVAGPQLMPHEEDYTGLATVDPDDPDALWLSTPVDPRDGGALAHHEIFHGATDDDGATWRWSPVTEGSAADNFRPIAVPGDPHRAVLAWYRGGMRSSQRYDAEVRVRVTPR